ncbi:MAG: hypothetical protein CRN43_19330 [Candidatus Nephrothrix sp. EaCA]|nr:MAG: hypothetical protein CRN43_19330 [Candidatus Nephrothrix sp. EaCA]
MKALKISLFAVAALLVLFAAAAILVPIVFKDDIKALIDKEIAKSVNADVKYNADDFSLSLFRHFPAVSVEMKNLSVYNREPFLDNKLFGMERLDVSLNLKDLIFGNGIRVKGISLIKPEINVKVLKDGRASWDIAVPSADTVKTAPSEPSQFSFGIDHWEIVDGHILYDDASIPFRSDVKGFNHSGNGDFTEKAFDLTAKSTIDSLSVAFAGVEYLSNKHLQLDIVIGISEEFTRYAFKENIIKMNDFSMNCDGWFKMNPNDFDMDIKFGSPENTFKSLLSLVPGIYTKSFKDIETSGDLKFGGFLKGKMAGKQLPAFNFALQVKDAMFKYPSLPVAVRNINVDLSVDNPVGIVENTLVNLKNLHLELGNNPVDAKCLIENLKNYKMNGELTAKLNLAELTKMFPLDSMELKGNYSLHARAEGIYDSLNKIIPKIDADMTLSNGYVKSGAFPMPLENVQVAAHIKNATGFMAQTVADINNFSMVLDGEPFGGSAVLQNLDDYTWDIKAKGGIDLAKMTKIFPLEGMTIAGKVKADLATKGKFSDVQAKRFEKLPTAGNATLKDFSYTAKDLPYKVTLSQAAADFNPQRIELKDTKGTIGNSDFAVSGAVTNYIGYVFGKETIKGNLNFGSNNLDMNEFMTEDPKAAKDKPKTDTTAMSAFPVPENIDFVLHADVKTAKMLTYVITQANGDIIVRDGIANLSDLKFNMLDGSFVMNGTYQAKDIKHPKYDMKLKIADLSIAQAAANFELVKKYVPIAGLVTGKFSTDFSISGELKKDMMPNLATVTGGGLLKVAQAALTKSKLIAGVTALSKLDNTDNVSLKDVAMSAAIANGQLSVQPFDIKFGSYTTTMAGFSTLDGQLNYTLNMKVPAGKLGLQGGLSQYLGAANASEEVTLPITLGGTVANPKFGLNMKEQKEQVKTAVANAAKEKGKEAIQEVLKGGDPKDVLKNIMKPKEKTADSAAHPATPAPAPATPVPAVPAVKKDSVVQQGVNIIKGLFNKKK